MDLSDLGVHVPRLLFFPECHSRETMDLSHCAQKDVRLLSLSRSPTGGNIVAHFSNGKELDLGGNLSFRAGGDLSVRERVSRKSLAAWLLAALQAEHGGLARRDFEELQELSVLETVTPRALYQLVREIGHRSGTIVWNPEETRFVFE